MLIKKILLPVLAIVILSCNDSFEANNCNKYRTGGFNYHFTTQEGRQSVSITRNDSVQYEVNITTGDSAKFDINWLGDCTYELKFVKGLNRLPDSLRQLRKKVILTTTILGGTDHYYLFRIGNDQSPVLLKDTIWMEQ